MRRARRIVVACIVGAAMLGPRAVLAQGDASTAASAGPKSTSAARPASASGSASANASASASGSASAKIAGPVDASAPLPAGHPHVDESSEEDPHAGAGAHGHGGMFEAPEDGSAEDPTIPAGAIEAQIADADGNPKPHVEVTLGIIYNSVAKGESRKRVTATTDAQGKVRFADLDRGSGVAYRTLVSTEGATFSAPPFRLGEKSGTRVLLHVYPIVHDIEKTIIASQSMIYVEVKDDRIQVQQAYKIYNVGRSAWVPEGLVIPLPPEFTAFTSQQGMTDVGVDAVPKQGVRLRGTFPPGQHVIEFRWQLPYGGAPDVKLEIGMPPHMAASRVIAPASRGMGLEVDGFPPPQATTDGQGQRALVTEKQLRRDEVPLKTVDVVIKGLPTEGPGKLIATFLAAGGLALGLVFGVRRPVVRDTKGERERLLRALAALEKAHADGDVGPKTYERSRREILDEIARTFAAEPSPRKKKRDA